MGYTPLLASFAIRMQLHAKLGSHIFNNFLIIVNFQPQHTCKKEEKMPFLVSLKVLNGFALSCETLPLAQSLQSLFASYCQKTLGEIHTGLGVLFVPPLIQHSVVKCLIIKTVKYDNSQDVN